MDQIEAKIQLVITDRRHGAAQLASMAVRVLMDVCRGSQAIDVQSLSLQLKGTAAKLANARPSMASIRNWCSVFARRFEQIAALGTPLEEARRRGLLLGEELLAQQQKFIRQQVEVAKPLLMQCKAVVTLSYSSTVEEILKHALPPACRVTIAESRPLMEGRRLFERLLDGVNEVRMITDAQIGLAIPAAEVVVVGADSLLSDLAVVNKTGTYLAGLVAKASERDFFVATDTYKINATMDSDDCVLEVKSGREVWPRYANQCHNVYFDITPSRLVTGFLSEEGLLGPTEMMAHVQRWRRLAETLEIEP
jgi:translation initiation factor 2B subunit (eIF-2B alpha/beta/delta family)